MINKFTIGGLVLLTSAIVAVPQQIVRAEEKSDTRIEKYENLTETESDTSDMPESEVDSAVEEVESEDDMTEPATRTEETLEEVQSDDSEVLN